MTTMRVVQPGAKITRHHRRPNFPIAGTMMPYGLYPIMAHLVLPGETLKSATTRWQVVGQPVKNPLAGAWLESWLFYVKLTDIDRALSDMFITDSMSTTGYTSGAANRLHFTHNGGIKWIEMCVNRIVEAYFINEGEGIRTMFDKGLSIPQAKLNVMSWYQNVMFEPAEVALDTSGPRDAVEQMRAWEMLQQMQMTEITYERYLEQYGVRAIATGQGDPEILRYTRSWTLPTNHIDPTDGSPSAAWVWRDEMKAEKDKRFDEPGFVVQMACVRPKMYNSQVLYSMIGNLWGFSDWYPAYNLPDPTAGIKNIGSDDPILAAGINGAEGEVQMLYDHRDLLNHGEQFVNDWAPGWAHPVSTGMSWLAADAPEIVRGEYAKKSDIEGLFVGATDNTRRLQYDGLTSLVIAGHVTDTTR